jgi:regulator of sirC expression with transglutaminase-like and TPR domain
MAETLETRLAFLQRQLHAINLAIQQAKGRDDQVAIERLRELYVRVATDVEQLKREALDKDMPSDFMLTLSRVSDQVVAVGSSIGQAVVTTAKLVKYLPWIALGLVVVVGLIYAGKIGKDLRK